MLVSKNAAGVPSVAKWVRVDSAANLALGTISGRVTERDSGTGIAGATVSYPGGPATTDSDGLYTIANIASGDQLITASATGYQNSPTRTVGVQANGDVTADFVLAPKPMYITGEALDRVTTLPVIGATVSYPGGTTTTDSLGRYTLSNTPPGTHTVVVSASDYISAFQEVVVTFGAYTTKDFALDSDGVPARVFTPVADAYTDTANPATNYGGATKLVLDKDAGAPRFDVTGLTGQVLSARLRLYVSNGGDHGGTIHSVANTYQGNATPWAGTASPGTTRRRWAGRRSVPWALSA